MEYRSGGHGRRGNTRDGREGHGGYGKSAWMENQTFDTVLNH